MKITKAEIIQTFDEASEKLKYAGKERDLILDELSGILDEIEKKHNEGLVASALERQNIDRSKIKINNADLIAMSSKRFEEDLESNTMKKYDNEELQKNWEDFQRVINEFHENPLNSNDTDYRCNFLSGCLLSKICAGSICVLLFSYLALLIYLAIILF
jgi:hypothetical protein